MLLAEYRLGHAGDQWLIEQRFTQPRKGDDVHVPAEPTTTLVKNGVILEWRQYGRQATVHNLEDWGVYQMWYYTMHLGLDAPRFILESNGLAAELERVRSKLSYSDYVGQPFLPEFLREHRSEYRVRSEPEEIDGRPCWVVEWPGVDTLWIDAGRGMAVVRRSYTWGPGKPSRMSIENSDFREVRPGLWMPFRQVVDRYASLKEPNDRWGQMTSHSEYQVQTIAFDDDVPATLFEVKLPPGTKIYDGIREFQYAISGEDAEPFEAVLNRPRPGTPSTKISFWVIVLNVAIIVVLVTAIFVRYRTRRSTAS